jgi:hypothetical protein
MASGAYSRGVLNIVNGTIVPGTTTTKMGLAQSSYSPAKTESSLTTFASSEATCTGYTGGFGGSGRKTASVTLTEQSGTQVVTIFTNLTWSALGGATNNTLGYAVWLKETTNDASSTPLAFLAFTATVTTNGSDIQVSFDATNGNVRWTV